MPSQGDTGGGGGEWEEDGSGNIVPIDGEDVGDGTTTADHQAVNTGELNGNLTGSQSLTDIAGSGLQINNGSLDASDGGPLSDMTLVHSGTASVSANGTFSSAAVDGEQDVFVRWGLLADDKNNATVQQSLFRKSDGNPGSQVVHWDEVQGANPADITYEIYTETGQ